MACLQTGFCCPHCSWLKQGLLQTQRSHLVSPLHPDPGHTGYPDSLFSAPLVFAPGQPSELQGPLGQLPPSLPGWARAFPTTDWSLERGLAGHR